MSLNKTMFYLSCRGRGRREGGQQSLSRGMEGRMEEKTGKVMEGKDLKERERQERNANMWRMKRKQNEDQRKRSEEVHNVEGKERGDD